MGYMELGIDFGSSYTSIYAKGQGIVLREPTVMVLEGDGTLSAAGEPAKKLIGKLPPDKRVCFPVFEGVVTSREAASQLLEYFLDKIMPARLFRPKIRAVLNVPCGASPRDKQTLEEAAAQVGVKEPIVVEGCLCQHLGLDFSFRRTQPVLTVDIGGGKTDVSVIADGRIVAGCTLGVGGNNVDTGIIDWLLREYQLKIGLLTAEKLKSTVCSLSERENGTSMVAGQDVTKNAPRSMLVSSKMLYPVIAHYYDKISEVVDVMVKSLPAEISGGILEDGIHLTGGGSKMAGLVPYLVRTLGYSYKTIANADLVSVLGAGKLCEDSKLLKTVFQL